MHHVTRIHSPREIESLPLHGKKRGLHCEETQCWICGCFADLSDTIGQSSYESLRDHMGAECKLLDEQPDLLALGYCLPCHPKPVSREARFQQATEERDRIKWDAYKVWAAYLAGRLGSRHRFSRSPHVSDPVACYICGVGAGSHQELFEGHVAVGH